VLINAQPGGILPSGTTAAILHITVSDPTAECAMSIVNDFSDWWGSPLVLHGGSIQVSVTDGGSYTYYAQCRNPFGRGSAVIQFGVSSSASAPTTIASHDFNDNTLGAFESESGTDLKLIDDPTASGRGKIASLHYAGTNQDRNKNVMLNWPTGIKFGRSIYFSGDLYLTPGTDLSDANAIQRKLLYYQPTPGMGLWSIVVMWGNTLHWDGGYVGNSGIDEHCTWCVWNGDAYRSNMPKLVTGRWYRIEHQITMNSSPAASDGIVRLWLDGALVFEKTNMRWTDPGWTSEHLNGAYFRYFLVGDQVNWGNGTYDEYRYWDNIRFSTQRN
jgi:hypothetical protein